MSRARDGYDMTVQPRFLAAKWDSGRLPNQRSPGGFARRRECAFQRSALQYREGSCRRAAHHGSGAESGPDEFHKGLPRTKLCGVHRAGPGSAHFPKTRRGQRQSTYCAAVIAPGLGRHDLPTCVAKQLWWFGQGRHEWPIPFPARSSTENVPYRSRLSKCSRENIPARSG